MLLERSGSDDDEQTQSAASSASSASIGPPSPSAMETSPLIPSPRSAVPPSPTPKQNGGSDGVPRSAGGTDPGVTTPNVATNGLAFVDQLIDEGCDKAVACGVFPSQADSICRDMLNDMADSQNDMRAKLKAGDCSYNSTAADRCLKAVNTLDCSALASGLGDVTALTSALMACTEAVVCP